MTFYVWGLTGQLMNFSAAAPAVMVDDTNFVENVQWDFVDCDHEESEEEQDGVPIHVVRMNVWVRRSPVTLRTGLI